MFGIFVIGILYVVPTTIISYLLVKKIPLFNRLIWVWSAILVMIAVSIFLYF
ncbi:MAG: hypothetical protein WDZ94_01335 [Patescibacteria group bacterium]